MRLQELYKKEVLPRLKEKFDIKNNLAVPKFEKVTINVSFGRHAKDKKYIESVQKNLTNVTGQKPVLTKAKKAISAFKVREGMTIGAMLNLRGKRMYNFIEKLVNIYFPRVRDFRGISEKSVDKQGNLTVGFRDVLAFSEIEVEDIENSHGLEISIITTTKNRKQGLELLRLMGFPFKKKE